MGLNKLKKVYRSGQREVRPVEPEAQDVGEHDAGVAESRRHHAERTPDLGMDRLGKVNGQRQRHDSETRFFSWSSLESSKFLLLH